MRIFLICSTTIMLCIALATLACQQEDKVSQGIYAPNGVLLSNSLEDLKQALASATQTPVEDFDITNVNFLDVKSGFVAEIGVKFISTQLHNKVYCVSPDLLDETKIEGEIRKSYASGQGTVDRVIPPAPFLFCDCNHGLWSDQGCTASITIQNGTITSYKCIANNCNGGCIVEIQF